MNFVGALTGLKKHGSWSQQAPEALRVSIEVTLLRHTMDIPKCYSHTQLTHLNEIKKSAQGKYFTNISQL